MILAGTVIIPVVLFDLAGGLARKGVSDYRACVGILFSAAGWLTAGIASMIPLATMAVLATYEEQNVKDALKVVRPQAKRLARLFVLGVFTVGGGLGLFILPGVWMAAAFAFAPFLCLFEGLRSRDALTGSREFFRGQAKGLFARFLAPAAPFLVFPWIPLAGMILAALYVPFFVAWQFLLYWGVKETMGPRTYSWQSGRAHRWTALAGWALAAALFLASAATRGVAASSPDSMVGEGIRSLRVRMAGINGVLDRRLPGNGKDALEELGPAIVRGLGAVEKKWMTRLSAGPSAPPATAEAPGKAPVVPGAPAAEGWRKYLFLGKESVSGFVSGVRRKAKGAMRFAGSKLLEWGQP